MNTIARKKFIYNMVNLNMKCTYLTSSKEVSITPSFFGYLVEHEGDDSEYMRGIKAYVSSHKDTCQDVIRQSRRFYNRHPLLADAINTIMGKLDTRLRDGYYESYGYHAFEYIDSSLFEAYRALLLSVLPVINDLSCRQYSDDDMMRIMMFFSAVFYEHAHTSVQQAEDILRVCDEVHPTYDMFVSLFTSCIISYDDKELFATIALYTTCPSYSDMTYSDICSVLDGTRYGDREYQTCMSYDTLRRFLKSDYAAFYGLKPRWDQYPMSYYTSLMDMYDSSSERRNYEMCYALLPYTFMRQQRKKFRYLWGNSLEYIKNIMKNRDAIDLLMHQQTGYVHHDDSGFSFEKVEEYSRLVQHISDTTIKEGSRSIIFEMALASRNKDIINSVPFVLRFIDDSYDIIDYHHSNHIAAIQQFFDIMGSGMPYDFAIESLDIACKR